MKIFGFVFGFFMRRLFFVRVPKPIGKTNFVIKF